jgi:ligand-binding sensor domain-containing protein
MERLLTILFTLLAITANAQMLRFHQLTVKDGLPHNSIITLAQDAKGDIWVATHGGLLKYDGRKFDKLPFEELPDKRVDRINRAQDGTMWVQCFERHQLVSRYDTISHHFVTYNVSDLSDSVRQQALQNP